jgi:hypothetical protein
MRLAVLLLLATSSTAIAAEEIEVSYALQLPALSVIGETASSKIDGGEETKSKTNTTIVKNTLIIRSPMGN